MPNPLAAGLVLTATCLAGFSPVASAAPLKVQIEIRPERGEPLADLEWTLSDCTSTAGSELVFPWNNLAYQLVMTCDEGRLEEVTLREWGLTTNGPEVGIYAVSHVIDASRPAFVLRSSAMKSNSKLKKKPFVVEVRPLH